MRDVEVREAYTQRAQEYTEKIGDLSATAVADRELVTRWAAERSGPVLDAGCGPGHWTAFLHEQGVSVQGMDLVPDFVAGARRRFPDLTFEVGSLHELAGSAAALDGVLAWYSVIHHDPADVPVVLAELARVLRPGGSLLLGFFEGPRLESFDHQVTTAWFWPVPWLTGLLASAGLEVQEVHTRADRPDRPHGAVVARRRL